MAIREFPLNLLLFNPDVDYRYPGRDARIDDDLGAKRIEWFRGNKMKGNPWNPVGDVSSDAITCKRPDFSHLKC